MRGKAGLVVGLAIGYVLGTRAGRERYEQIKTQWLKVWHLDPVQEQVGKVKDFAKSSAMALPSTLWDSAVKVTKAATTKGTPGERLDAALDVSKDQADEVGRAAPQHATAERLGQAAGVIGQCTVGQAQEVDVIGRDAERAHRPPDFALALGGEARHRPEAALRVRSTTIGDDDHVDARSGPQQAAHQRPCGDRLVIGVRRDDDGVARTKGIAAHSNGESSPDATASPTRSRCASGPGWRR